MTLVRVAAAIVAMVAARGAVTAQEIAVTPLRPSGVYGAGETIGWDLEVQGEGAAQVTEVQYVLKRNGLAVVREGVLPLADGKGRLEASLSEPGTLLAELTARLPGREIRALGGAALSPEQIRPSVPRPRDFDRFWRAKLAELKAVAPRPVLETAESGDPGVEYYKLRMGNIRGTHIYGQLAKPRGKERLPALLIVQWAGVYPLSPGWVVGRAKSGWLTLNIMAHDLPFDQPESFYKRASETTLLNYPAIGNDDRERSTFLRMYLSCYRAADYLARRPDWDRRTLVVTGSSQGGLQAIVTAALHPRVSAALALVPAGCDLNGPEAGRAPGWPMWYWQTQGKDARKVRETSRYFDVVNFAPRVRCPTLVGLGLVDTTCPAPGVFAMTNLLRGPKEVVVMPGTGHGGPFDAYARRAEAWLGELARGGRAPVGAP